MSERGAGGRVLLGGRGRFSLEEEEEEPSVPAPPEVVWPLIGSSAAGKTTSMS